MTSIILAVQSNAVVAYLIKQARVPLMLNRINARGTRADVTGLVTRAVRRKTLSARYWAREGNQPDHHKSAMRVTETNLDRVSHVRYQFSFSYFDWKLGCPASAVILYVDLSSIELL